MNKRDFFQICTELHNRTPNARLEIITTAAAVFVRTAHPQQVCLRVYMPNRRNGHELVTELLQQGLARFTEWLYEYTANRELIGTGAYDVAILPAEPVQPPLPPPSVGIYEIKPLVWTDMATEDGSGAYARPGFFDAALRVYWGRHAYWELIHTGVVAISRSFSRTLMAAEAKQFAEAGFRECFLEKCLIQVGYRGDIPTHIQPRLRELDLS